MPRAHSTLVSVVPHVEFGLQGSMLAEAATGFQVPYLCRIKEETMIQVKSGCGCDCREWAILELQGVVEAQSSSADRLQGLEIGRLCHISSPGSYTFTVGYHELSGKKIALKKPLLVLQKKRFSNPDAPNSSTAELDIIGIIRHKILFDTRPKALISKTQAKEKKIGANS